MMELKCEMKLSFVGLVFATYTIDRRDAWKDNEGTEYMSAKEPPPRLPLLCVNDSCLETLVIEDQQNKLRSKGRRSLP